MGICGYNKWLHHEYRSAFVPSTRAPRVYDHVYVDVNNLLHVAAHHSRSERTFFKKLFALLDNRLAKTSPRHSVTLALDGPAPMAKTITQRRRRIRLSAGAATPLSDDMCKLLKIGITPGSVLALKIDRALEYYVARRMLRKERDEEGDNLLYEISSMRVAGEGEIKLVKSIQQRLNNPRFEGHSHCIVTEDSDALLLAMTLFGQGNAQHAENEQFQVFVMSDNGVFSARVFDELLLKSLPKGASLDSARRDFIGLSAMMGNDYINGSKLGVKSSWKAYLEMRATYRFRDDPLFPMPPSKDTMSTSSKRRNIEQSDAGIQTTVNWKFLRQLARKLVVPGYDPKFAESAERWASRKTRVYEYLYGVEWMLSMYYDGECSDFSFFSVSPGPNVDDFWDIPDEYDISCDPLRDLKRAEASFYNRSPITPLAYSLAVIPRGGRAMISRNIRPLVDPGSHVRKLFTMDYCVQCIKHRMHVSPMENAMQNATLLQQRDPGFQELVATSTQFSRFSKYTDDEGYIIDPESGDYMALEEMRDELKALNRLHLDHLTCAVQHSSKDPVCLPTLEAAVARISADSKLTEDEEMLRTLATPILMWRRSDLDPPDLDSRDFAGEKEQQAWQSKIIPSGFRPLVSQCLEIRKYDGDIGDLLARWGAENALFNSLDEETAQLAESDVNFDFRGMSEFDVRLQKARASREAQANVPNLASPKRGGRKQTRPPVIVDGHNGESKKPPTSQKSSRRNRKNSQRSSAPAPPSALARICMF